MLSLPSIQDLDHLEEDWLNQELKQHLHPFIPMRTLELVQPFFTLFEF